ncbi:MAG: TlpA family protein disulfide reductase, partial [Candidatus Pelagibacter ubique]
MEFKNKEYILMKHKVQVGVDTISFRGEEIIYFNISCFTLPEIKVPVFKDDTLSIIVDWVKKNWQVQSKNYQAEYEFFENIKNKLSEFESNIYKNVSDPNNIKNWKEDFNKFYEHSKELILKLKNEIVKREFLGFFIVNYLYIKAKYYLYLFTKTKKISNDFPSLNEIIQPLSIINKDYKKWELESLFDLIINLHYLKNSKLKPITLFSSTSSVIRKYLNQELSLKFAVGLISFLMEITKDEKSLTYFKRKLKIISESVKKLNNNFLEQDVNRLLHNIEIRLSLLPRKQAPNLTLIDINGEIFNLFDLKGRPIILVFWGTWCAPCLEDIEYFLKNKEKFDFKAFNLVFVALENRNFDKWKDF